MKSSGSAGNGQAPTPFGFKEILKDSFAKSNDAKNAADGNNNLKNQFNFQKQSYSMKSLKTPGINAAFQAQSTRNESQLMNLQGGADSQSKIEKDVLSEIDSMIGDSKPQPTPQKPSTANSWGSGASTSKPVFNENPKASLTSKPTVQTHIHKASPAPAATSNSDPPASPSLTNFFAPVQAQSAQQMQIGFGGDLAAVYKQDRDLCDVATAREVWTSFEASKLFLEKQKNNAVLPPVEYKFGDIKDFQAQNEWSAKSEKIVKKLMKLPGFRPMQQEIINALFLKNDVYYSAPEGTGRSIIYEIPAMVEKGFTIVLAPNFGTIEPHMLGIHQLEMPYMHERIDNGTYFHSASLDHSPSQTTPDATLTVLKRMLQERKCTVKFIFMTPGKPQISAELKETLKECHFHKIIQRIVVYDVQALSKLSHQYSPSFVDLVTSVVNTFKEASAPQTDSFGAQVPQAQGNPNPSIFAVSSEASRFIREDTMDFLGMYSPLFFYHSFFKPNHRNIVVERKQAEVDQLAQILEENYKDMCGIVYVNTPRNCDTIHKGVAKVLNLNVVEGQKFMPIEAYHTKMTLADRERVLEAWKSGIIKTLIVCVVGLPIKWHKHDIRFTIHFNLPKSLEIYYHQGGVAGRDGNLADSILLYTSRDIIAFEETTSHSQSSAHSLHHTQSSESTGAHFESGWILAANKFEFNELIRFAEEDTHCRKQILCNIFGQLTKREDCKVHCDNCSANYLVKSSNHIEAVRTILRFYASVAPTENPLSQGASHHSKNPDLTLNQLSELLRGKLQTVPQKMKKAMALNELLPQLPKKELSYLLTCLLRNGYLKTKTIGTINGSYQALTLDSQYFRFYRGVLEDKDANFTLRTQSKRRNNDAIEDYLTAARNFENTLKKLGSSMGLVSDSIGFIAIACSQHLQGPLSLCEMSEMRYSLENIFRESAQDIYKEMAEQEAAPQPKSTIRQEPQELMAPPKKPTYDRGAPTHKGVHEYLQKQIQPSEAGITTGFDQELDELLLSEAVALRTDKTPKQLQEIVSSVLPSRGSASTKKVTLPEKKPQISAREKYGKCLQEELYHDLDTRIRTVIATFNALEQKSKKPNQSIANLSSDSMHKLCLTVPLDLYNWDMSLGTFVAKSVPEELKHKILWEMRHFVFVHGIEGTGNLAQKLIQPTKRVAEDDSNDILKEVDSMFRSESPTNQTVDIQENYSLAVKPSWTDKDKNGASQIDNELEDLLSGELDFKPSYSQTTSLTGKTGNSAPKQLQKITFSNAFTSLDESQVIFSVNGTQIQLDPQDQEYLLFLKQQTPNMESIKQFVGAFAQKLAKRDKLSAARSSEENRQQIQNQESGLVGQKGSVIVSDPGVSQQIVENQKNEEEYLGKRTLSGESDLDDGKKGSPMIGSLFGTSLFDDFNGLLEDIDVNPENSDKVAAEKNEEAKDLAISTADEASKDVESHSQVELPKKKSRRKKSDLEAVLQSQQQEEGKKGGEKKKRSVGKGKKGKSKAMEETAEKVEEISMESSEHVERSGSEVEPRGERGASSKVEGEGSPTPVTSCSPGATQQATAVQVTIDLVESGGTKAQAQTPSPRKLITSKQNSPGSGSAKAKGGSNGFTSPVASPKPYTCPLTPTPSSPLRDDKKTPPISALNEQLEVLFGDNKSHKST